jgi:hypothetical protein
MLVGTVHIDQVIQKHQEHERHHEAILLSLADLRLDEERQEKERQKSQFQC